MAKFINWLRHLTKAQVSFAYGIFIGAATFLIQSGVLGGSATTAAQKILTTVIAFASAVGIRSALPPKN
jgi:hypothetical protein